MYSSAHPLAQQALFQGRAFLRIVSLEVSDTICRSSLAYEGPVGTPILTWHHVLLT